MLRFYSGPGRRDPALPRVHRLTEGRRIQLEIQYCIKLSWGYRFVGVVRGEICYQPPLVGKVAFNALAV